MSERAPYAVHETITVDGLSDDENRTANKLLEQLAKKLPRNLRRDQYYDGKRALAQMSSVVPPQYNNLGIVLGWNAKAVDLLARRCNLDGFVWPGGDLGSLGFENLWDDNQLGAETDQGVVSSLIHATAFVATTAGGAGEPDALVQFLSATDTTGGWNGRTRRLSSALSVTRRDTDGRPEAFALYETGLTIQCEKADGRWVVTDRDTHRYGMLVDALPYRPRLKRRFGSSRISRATMGLQDAAVRALIRLEGHMDVYSFPEYWLLGADSSVFGDQSRFEVMLGRIKAVPDDDDSAAANPRASVQQFAAASPEPHLADVNALSKLFARETSLPDSSLAITDFSNPTAADAYDAAQYDLIAEAEGATDEWTPPIRRAVVRALAIQNGTPDIPDEWRSIAPQWRSPRFLSRAAEADAGMKQVTAIPWLAETSVGLKLLGLSPQDQRQALAEKQRARYSQAVSSLTNVLTPDQRAEFGELVEEGADGGDGG